MRISWLVIVVDVWTGNKTEEDREGQAQTMERAVTYLFAFVLKKASTMEESKRPKGNKVPNNGCCCCNLIVIFRVKTFSRISRKHKPLASDLMGF